MNPIFPDKSVIVPHYVAISEGCYQKLCDDYNKKAHDDYMEKILGKPTKKYLVKVYKNGIQTSENELSMMVSEQIYKQMVNLAYEKF